MYKQLIRSIPFFYTIRIAQLRLQRKLVNRRIRFASKQEHNQPLPYCVKKHQSILRRRLGDSDPVLQDNKVINLGLAVPTIHNILLAPGETFSLWNRVGKPTAAKGYVEGLLLSQGEVKTGIGGGLCQLANLLYWMVLHTPLKVKERHHHSFDPFPDDHRVLPFGSGASVFYNYIDLQFTNPTERTFQIQVWITDQHLKGKILIDDELPVAYHLEERNHRFYRGDNGKVFRENEIWRKEVDKRTGLFIGEQRLIRNHAEVKYEWSAEACSDTEIN